MRFIFWVQLFRRLRVGFRNLKKINFTVIEIFVALVLCNLDHHFPRQLLLPSCANPRDLLEDFEVFVASASSGNLSLQILWMLLSIFGICGSASTTFTALSLAVTGFPVITVLEKTRSSQVLPFTYFHFCRVSIIPRLWLHLFAASLSAPRGVASSWPMSWFVSFSLPPSGFSSSPLLRSPSSAVEYPLRLLYNLLGGLVHIPVFRYELARRSWRLPLHLDSVSWVSFFVWTLSSLSGESSALLFKLPSEMVLDRNSCVSASSAAFSSSI